METTTATITVLDIQPVQAGKLLALADVEMVLDGISLVLHGIQVRADANGTKITLPNYRAPSGEWRSAISMPDELRGPMGVVVIAAAMVAGLLVEKSPVAG